MTLQNSENILKAQTCVTEKARQGDSLSAALFKLILERIIKEAGISITRLMFHKKYRRQSKEELVRVSEEKGLEINQEKT